MTIMNRHMAWAGLAVMAAVSVIGPAARQSEQATTQTAAFPSITIMSMGDSISVGDSYRVELSRLLNKAGMPHRYIIAAEGGSGCITWKPRAYALTRQHHPDIVLLSCGTNDGPQPSQGGTFEQTYRDLITNLLGGGEWRTRVIPSFIQYSSFGGYPYPTRAPAWLKTTEPVANDAIYRALFWNDPHGRLRIPAWADFQKIPETYLDSGGVHPTTAGYIVMARIWYEALQKVYGLPPLTGDDRVPCGMDGSRPGWGKPYAPTFPGCPRV